jgi:hypothetical protein
MNESMGQIETLLGLKVKPNDKRTKIVKGILAKDISIREFIAFFEGASDVDKGTCADVMKQISTERPDVLVGSVDVLIRYINYKAPRVKWGLPEAIGHMAKEYPDQVEKAIPFLLRNITDRIDNTTVIRWCSAFALAEIAKSNPHTRKQLLPIFRERIEGEKNNGVRNVYVKALKVIENE